MKDEDLFDPAEFRISDAELPEILAVVPRKIQKRRQHFIKVPMSWHEKLNGAAGQTVLLAQYVLYLHWKGGGEPVKLPNGMLKRDGIGRHAKWRGLRDLENRGLIKVECRPRKSPIVKVFP